MTKNEWKYPENFPKKEKGKELQSLENLKQKLDQENGSPWSYFAGKDLFVNNLEKCSGYSVSNFKKEWSDACKLQKKLLGDLVKMFEKEGA